MEFVLRSNVTVHQPVTWRDVDSVFDVHFFVNRQNRAMRTNSLDPRIFRLLCCVFALTSLATLLVGCQTPEIWRNDGGNDSDVPTGAVDAVSDRADVGAPVEDARSDQLDAPSIEVDSGGPASLFARPIAPLSLGDVSLRRPTLRWELPAATDGAVVDLCRDRACTMVIETLRAPGTSVRPTMPLPPNSAVFWRLRATRGVDVSATFVP